LYGLASAVGFGISEFLAKYAINRSGYYRSLIHIQFLGVLFLLGPSLASGVTVEMALADWDLLLVLGVLNLIANYSLFYAYQHGQLSVIAPIVSTFSVYTVALSFLVLGERPDPLQVAGIGLAILGVICISIPYRRFQFGSYRKMIPGAGAGLLSAVTFGVLFFLFKFSVDSLGPLFPVLFFRTLTVMVLLMDSRIRNSPVLISQGKVVFLLALAGGLDALSYFLYNAGIQWEYASLVATLCGLYPAVSIVLARMYLHERLGPIQSVGVFLILIGISFISFG
jgi:drug/metabolite transporter (DMT)-like permease